MLRLKIAISPFEASLELELGPAFELRLRRFLACQTSLFASICVDVDRAVYSDAGGRAPSL